jgi:hypothetical protein
MNRNSTRLSTPSLKDTHTHIYGLLIGSDAVVYQNMRALGFEPVLYFHYRDEATGTFIEWISNFGEVEAGDDLEGILRDRGGTFIRT